MLKTGAAVLAASAACGMLWSYPSYSVNNHSGRPHDRVFGQQEQDSIKCMGNQMYDHTKNPGIHVFPSFLSQMESLSLLSEVKGIQKNYGISLISPMHAAMYRFQMSYLRPPIPQVNMLRVTGRPEAVGQKLPPWGYGDSFDEGKLPPSLKALVQKVRAISGLSLGPLRDVTVNYRHSHFYRLDPHVDPQLDGDHVFIIGLDSDTVLTLCPLNFMKLTEWINNIWSILTLEDERDLVQRQAYKSWTSLDLDVLLKKSTLVLLTGDARWRWTHGTRLGIQVPDLSGLHDWWGDHTLVVEREGERSSVVLAFACLE